MEEKTLLKKFLNDTSEKCKCEYCFKRWLEKREEPENELTNLIRCKGKMNDLIKSITNQEGIPKPGTPLYESKKIVEEAYNAGMTRATDDFTNRLLVKLGKIKEDNVESVDDVLDIMNYYITTSADYYKSLYQEG